MIKTKRRKRFGNFRQTSISREQTVLTVSINIKPALPKQLHQYSFGIYYNMNKQKVYQKVYQKAVKILSNSSCPMEFGIAPFCFLAFLALAYALELDGQSVEFYPISDDITSCPYLHGENFPCRE